MVPRVGSIGFWPGRPDDEDDADEYPESRGGTLQQERGSRANPRFTDPGFDPPSAGVPDLAALTRAALNALDDHAGGFFLHVEGGAVDWAMHANQTGRMIEELIDFKAAIRAVVAWTDAADAWDETLLVVTADHDHMLWGPRANERPFDPLRDRGAGKLPGYRWLSTGHSSALVPVFARGAGVEALTRAADETDPFRGRYLDQTEIHAVLAAVLGGGAAR
jgi:alkaline phosphatase